MWLSCDAINFIYLVIIIAYVIFFPFNKVEESFNLQAIHDLLIHTNKISSYDHLEFPGVVPRTFIGSIVVATITKPFQYIINHFELTKYSLLLIARAVLGFLTWLSFTQYNQAIQFKFGTRCQLFIILIHIFQFHIPFYSSRTLPNTFALVASYLAYSRWFKGKGLQCLLILGVAAILFRCDLILLILPLTIQLLLCQEIQLLQAVIIGIIYAILALGCTVLIDSYFWQKWVWPEGVVLFFNTVENKSHEWGVMSWHWYFTSALLRAMHIWYPLALLGFLSILHYPIHAINAHLEIHTSPSTAINDTDDMNRHIHIDTISRQNDISIMTLFLHTFTRPFTTPTTTTTTTTITVPNTTTTTTTTTAANATTATNSSDNDISNSSINTSDSTKHESITTKRRVHVYIQYYTLPALCYLILYSFLPHKELRFIFPIFPLLNLLVAKALDDILPPPTTTFPSSINDTVITSVSKLQSNDKVKEKEKEMNGEPKSLNVSPNGRPNTRLQEFIKNSKNIQRYNILLYLAVVGLFIIASGINSIFAMASYYNYPGGTALRTLLHTHIPITYKNKMMMMMNYTPNNLTPLSIESTQSSLSSVCNINDDHNNPECQVYNIGNTENLPIIHKNISIHIDVAAAMTGVSRFLQEETIKINCNHLSSYVSADISSTRTSTSTPCTILHLQYSKVESNIDYTTYDYLLTENPNDDHIKSTSYITIDTINGFSHMAITLRQQFPIIISPILKPMINILQKKSLFI